MQLFRCRMHDFANFLPRLRPAPHSNSRQVRDIDPSNSAEELDALRQVLQEEGAGAPHASQDSEKVRCCSVLRFGLFFHTHHTEPNPLSLPSPPPSDLLLEGYL